MFLFAQEEGGGSFLVSPNVGLMIWTLLAFGFTLYLLNKLAFPRMRGLDKRARRSRTRRICRSLQSEADSLLESTGALR